MRRLFFLIALAIVIRLFFFLFIFTEQPHKFDIRDLDGYANIAKNLITTGVYSREVAPPLTPDLSRPPVYPLVLAVLMLLGQNNGSIIVLFQIILGAALVGATYLLSRELHFGKAAAYGAALMVTLDPILILLGHYLLAETLFILEWTISLWLYVRYRNSWKLSYLINSAILLALAALTRPILEFLPFILLLPLMILSTERNWRAKIRDSVVFICLFSILLVPWMLRNQSLSGEFSLSDISDTNLYYYRAKAVLADAEQISQDVAYQKLDDEIKQIRLSHPGSAQPVQQAMRTRALQILTQYPLQTLKMTVRGAVLLLFDPGYSLVCTDLDPGNFSPECFQGEASMLQNNIFAMMVAKFFDMSIIQKITLSWSFLMMGLLYLTGGLGAIQLLRQKQWQAFGLLVGSILYFVALSSGAESLYRLRAPILPLLAILSGFWINYLIVERNLKIPH